MKTFLDDAAGYINDHFGHWLEDICIVVPNKRSALFFREAFANTVEKPSIAPVFMTISELMEQISGTQKGDRLGLLFRLHKAYCKVRGQEESFDQFFGWGEILLRDFDEVDKYLVNAEDLFVNVKDWHALTSDLSYLTEAQLRVINMFWETFEKGPVSDQKVRFSGIWDLLAVVYKVFQADCSKNGIVSEGRLYRRAATNAKAFFSKSPWKQIVFTGFNALNKSEFRVFKAALESEKGVFLWDYDERYVLEKSHEAGRFLRNNLKYFPSPKGFGPSQNLREVPADKFHVVAVSGKAVQGRWIGSRLASKQRESWREVGVVLPDEGALFPVLGSIPENVKRLNITMGYPMGELLIYTLIRQVMELHFHAKGKGRDIFHHEILINVLNHPVVLSEHAEASRKIVQDIRRKNRVYVGGRDLSEGKGVMEVIFRPVSNGSDLLTLLIQLLEYLRRDSEEEESSNVEQEYLLHFQLELRRLETLLKEHVEGLEIETLVRIVRRVLESKSLPFEGEPLEGLQIMGILETRLLDFKELYLLDFNEGVFPGRDAPVSLIPPPLRKGFGLPLIDHQDALSAYLFYRAVQRAEKVYLVYDANSDTLTGGEPSRFLYQLLYELAPDKVKEVKVRNEVQSIEPWKISVCSTDHVVSRLNAFTTFNEERLTVLTPSAINQYLDCSLKFYFSYVLGLKEAATVREDVDAVLFGTLLHDILESVYKPFAEKHQVVDSGDFKRLRAEERSLIEAAIDKAYTHDAEQTLRKQGHQLLIRSILSKYFRKVMSYDERTAPLRMLGVELDKKSGLWTSKQILSGEKKVSIRLGGIIDRVDQVGSAIRILDYKTGADSREFGSIESLFDREDEKRNKAAFQIIFYSWLYTHCFDTHEMELLPGLVNIREVGKTGFVPNLVLKGGRGVGNTVIQDARPFFPEFEERLTNLLEQIFSPDNQFEQTLDVKKCQYCPYSGICKRD